MSNISEILFQGKNVKKITIDGGVFFEKSAPPAELPYLCFTAVEAGATLTMNVNGNYSDTLPVLEYSVDGVNWLPFVLDKNNVTNTVLQFNNVGDKVWLRGDNDHFSEDTSIYIYFVMSKKIAASGNVMSLVDKSCERLSMGEYMFCRLFQNTPLVTAPELPATTLARVCYRQMFLNCTSLAMAPELPARYLAPSCYYGMFNGCTSLMSMNVAFSSWFTDYATYNWTNNVSSNGTFTCPASLPDTRGKSNIPTGWTRVDKT